MTRYVQQQRLPPQQLQLHYSCVLIRELVALNIALPSHTRPSAISGHAPDASGNDNATDENRGVFRH